jgi:hypothetical protein
MKTWYDIQYRKRGEKNWGVVGPFDSFESAKIAIQKLPVDYEEFHIVMITTRRRVVVL